MQKVLLLKNCLDKFKNIIQNTLTLSQMLTLLDPKHGFDFQIHRSVKVDDKVYFLPATGSEAQQELFDKFLNELLELQLEEYRQLNIELELG